MKKKATLVITIVALMTMAIVGGTLAWFTSSGTVTNILNAGKIAVTVAEPNYKPDEGNSVNKVVPGAVITKDPTITNTGDDARIRYKVDITLLKAKVDEAGNRVIGDDGKPVLEEVALPTGDNALVFNKKVVTTKDGIEKIEYQPVVVTDNTWVDLGKDKVVKVDGVDVTAKIVEEKAAPTVIFDSVSIPKTWGNDYQDAKLTIRVDVQAAQAENFTSTDWDSAFKTSTPK